jgi:hypothetical protein
LEPKAAAYLVLALTSNPAAADDPHIPLLAWWVAEAAIARDPFDGAMAALPPDRGARSRFGTVTAERVARRLMAEDLPDGPRVLATLLTISKDVDPTPLVNGVAQALQGRSLTSIPEPLREPFASLRAKRPNDEALLEALARMGDVAAVRTVVARVTDQTLPDPARV